MMPARSEAFKERRRERRHQRAAESHAREAALTAPLRAAGHSCRDCKHMEIYTGHGPTCTLDNEGPWFTPVRLDHLCSRWGTW